MSEMQNPSFQNHARDSPGSFGWLSLATHPYTVSVSDIYRCVNKSPPKPGGSKRQLFILFTILWFRHSDWAHLGGSSGLEWLS